MSKEKKVIEKHLQQKGTVSFIRKKMEEMKCTMRENRRGSRTIGICPSCNEA